MFSAAILLIAGAAHAAQDGLGRYGASYLLQPLSVRAEGMGDAYAALTEDSQALFYNPAGLAFVARPELGSMFAPQADEQRVWSLEYAHPVGSALGVGAGFVGQDIGGIEGRQGEFDVPTQIDSKEGAFALAVGYAPAADWSFGLGGKYLYQRFGGLPDSASGFGFDAGVRFSPDALPRLTFAASGENLGARLKWSTGRTDPVASSARAGAAFQLAQGVFVAADVQVLPGGLVRAHGGFEGSYSAIALRVGADHDRPTLGFGVVTPPAKLRFKFDYAFELGTRGFDDVHRFGFSWRL